jgi:putative tryptophan/tyrosine transport system substrate-binding protein
MRQRSVLAAALSVTALACAAIWPNLVCAADPAQRIVRMGFVSPLSAATISPYNNTFWKRLPELGWVEGQNLVIEARSAEGHLERLPALIAEVIERKVDVLVTYGEAAAIAAKKATSTVPIVVAVMPDPVRSGLVASLARPGGNLTGMSGGDPTLNGKMLELLQEAVPRLSTVAVIVNPNNPMARNLAQDLQAFAPTRRLKLHIIELRGPEGLDRAFEQARRTARAIVVVGEPITLEHRGRVIALAAKYRLPAIYLDKWYVNAGGLMAHGPDYPVMWRRAAEYVDKILRGAKPEDLPIEQPTRYVLSVNLKTAKALGLTIPESILLRADEVIR